MGDNMKYETVKYFSHKWKISERRIRTLCDEGRIENVTKVGRSWNIPVNSIKPSDKRVRKDRYEFDINVDFSVLDALILQYEEFKPLSQNQLRMLREDLDLRWTYNSNAIEGNTLTLKETKVAIEGITIGGKSVIEHLEVVNHMHALDFFYDVSSEKISQRTIKDIHRLILINIDNENAGKYRDENVIISGADHKPPKFYDLPILMNEFIEKIDLLKMYHPITRSAIVHGEFVKIHPFIDGNGRTSRILMNMSLINSKMIPIVIKKESRLIYYEALDKAHTQGDYNDFVKLLVDLAIDEYNLRLSLLS